VALKGAVSWLCRTSFFEDTAQPGRPRSRFEGAGREIGFGYRWLIAMLVREGMPVNPKRACTGCIARKVSDEDSATMPEAIVLDSGSSNLPVLHYRVSVDHARPLNRVERFVGRFKHNRQDSNWTWLSRCYRCGRDHKQVLHQAQVLRQIEPPLPPLTHQNNVRYVRKNDEATQFARS